jgi:putative Holliday junction resolvase
MGRILSIDYGRKRVGIAVTDILRITANGLTTVPVAGIFDFLSAYFAKETVDTVVVGLPKQMDNEPSESMKYIEPFVNGFRKRFPSIPVVMFDERFTSVLAHKAMLEGGLKKKDRQNKALVDQISATILLQSYMESRSNYQL